MKWNEKTESLEFDDFGDGTTAVQGGYKVMYVAEINRQLKKWFDTQPRVYGCTDPRGDWSFKNGGEDWTPSHKALLIGVTKIKEETVEDVLMELVELMSETQTAEPLVPNRWTHAIDRAKRILEKK